MVEVAQFGLRSARASPSYSVCSASSHESLCAWPSSYHVSWVVAALRSAIASRVGRASVEPAEFGDPVDREARSVAVGAEAFCDNLGALGFDCGDRRASSPLASSSARH